MKLITVKELSESTSIKKSTLYLWVSARKIPHYRIGQLVRFKAEEIEEWLEEFRKEPCPAVKLKKPRRFAGSSDADNIVRKAIDDAKGFKV